MDSACSLQDLVRCHLCETPIPPLHCVICTTHLCEDCKVKHLSDKSNEHKVVPFKYRGYFPKCQKHSTKICDQYCEHCNIPVCEFCVSSKEHQTHDVINILSREENKKQLDTLLETSMETEGTMRSGDTSSDESSPPVMVIAQIKTKFGGSKRLHCVSCLTDEAIWLAGDDKTMRLYNLQGELVRSIETKSENWPQDIEVSKTGELVYSDKWDKTVNIENTSDIKELIRSTEWMPRGVCLTSTGGLLVVMVRGQQTKVVRFSGSTETQSIQFDDKRQPLYSTGELISENRNLDICVSDPGAHAIVVVNEAGKLRFSYAGARTTTKEPFDPRGITTDSQNWILTSERFNSRIHIIDKDGQFLRYIEDSDLRSPHGLCIDTRDNLFVAESKTGKVKKIQYYM
nr:tripartite motif-containing protein 2-like [Crassostrea gigas]